LNLTLLYRGPLQSCNFSCEYCPFGKKVDQRRELDIDHRALERFVEWVRSRTHDRLRLFFTPWGEALIHPYYQQTLAELSRLPHIEKVAIQTNLSCRLGWLTEACPSTLAFWSTYHPEWVTRQRFVEQVCIAHNQGFRVSCGVVGFPKFIPEIMALRKELPSDIYLWVNAVKGSLSQSYSKQEQDLLEQIDPLFPINQIRHPSYGRACRAGSTVVTVDGDGTLRRCHFISTPLGNIYQEGFEEALIERSCSNQTCGCHIGYIHMDHLEMKAIFGDGMLERIPESLKNASQQVQKRLPLRVIP
jgi:MoaA/NifB/PqqE/SkfB family radical SAM enzyme